MFRKDYLQGRSIVIDTLPIENQPEEKDVSSIPDLLKIIFTLWIFIHQLRLDKLSNLGISI